MAGPLLVWESGATLSVHGLTVAHSAPVPSSVGWRRRLQVVREHAGSAPPGISGFGPARPPTSAFEGGARPCRAPWRRAGSRLSAAPESLAAARRAFRATACTSETHGASLCGVGYAEPKQTFPGDIICRTYAFAEELARAVQSRAPRAGLDLKHRRMCHLRTHSSVGESRGRRRPPRADGRPFRPRPGPA